MGCGASMCNSNAKDGEVLWYDTTNERSLFYQNATRGFGIGRNKSFHQCIARATYHNREGNIDGELAGKIRFYQRVAKNENYGKLDDDPVIMLKRGSKIFGKLFLRVPLGRLPIGENNLLPHKELKQMGDGQLPKGSGAVLLAMMPRVVALFVTVDGKVQNHEHLCHESVNAVSRHYQSFKPRPLAIGSAVPNSFFTFMVSRDLDEFFFLHFPLLCGLAECELETGCYGKSMVAAFSSLFSSLGPGPHDVTVKVQCYYDHCDFNYFPLNININALGKWYSGLSNLYLKYPHPHQLELVNAGGNIAEGKFKVVVPRGFDQMLEGLLDRKPPKERYWKSDKEELRKEARIIAAGHFCESFDVEGLPDVLVLTSELEERPKKDAETGYNYKYEYVEFGALWLNARDPSPNAEGTLLQGGMARGEVIPRQPTRVWAWDPLQRAGNVVKPIPFGVMNKYIRAKMATCGRRPSFSKLL